MDRINVDLLRTFVEVSRIEHLGRAAEALQSDQSTVSRKIARLEKEVGVPLFERIGRSIRLTQAGKRFVTRAERMLGDVRDAVVEAAGTVSAESGEVHVGFLHTVGARWLPERLARFLESYPGVRFVLTEGTTAEVVAGLLDGRFDIGILGPPPVNTPELHVVPLFRERVSVVVPAHHRLVGRSSVTLHDIAARAADSVASSTMLSPARAYPRRSLTRATTSPSSRASSRPAWVSLCCRCRCRRRQLAWP